VCPYDAPPLPQEFFARLIRSNGDGAAVLGSIGAVRVRFAEPHLQT